ncbi:MAG: hypothetical protein L6Q78_05155 [Bacteroidia bacterium]|nr:hypothetical protein [Bacteroidia bacterium]
MKKILLKASLYGLVAGFASLPIACKLKTPTEGFQITVRADAINAPSFFNLVDAKSGYSDAAFENLEVKITGKDADKVYSATGRKDIYVKEGALLISLRKGVVPTITNPIEYTINIEANGFLSEVYTVKLYSAAPVTQTISLVKITNLPGGMGAKTQLVSAAGNGEVSTDVSIVSDAGADKSTKATLSISSGTILKDASGNPVSGEVESRVIHNSVNSAESYEALPGKMSDLEIKDATGATLSATQLRPVGLLTIDMTSGGKEVKSFSKPVNSIIEIPDGMLNPTTSAPYKEGDLLDVFSKNDNESNWVREGSTTITKNSTTGKLEANMSITHLSSWLVGLMSTKCNFTLNTPTILKDTEEPLVVTFQPIIRFSSLLTIEGTEITAMGNDEVIRNAIASSIGINVDRIRINAVRYLSQDLSLSKNALELPACNATLTLDYRGTSTDVINFYFRAKCKSGSMNFATLPPNTTVYFIEESVYQNLANYVNGHRVYPIETSPSGVSWTKMISSDAVYNNNPYSKTNLLKSLLKPGTKYRASVYYGTGQYTERIDYLYDTPPGATLPNSVVVEFEVERCSN